MWKHLFVFALVLTLLSGLKIVEHSSNPSKKYKTFEHRTADFGPNPGQYQVSGPLQMMSPLLGCNIAQYTNQTQSNEDTMVYTQIYKEQIVLILRGNCTFFTKALNAQSLGAVGVIIGDYNTSDIEWIVMSSDPSKDGSATVTIPSIFVPHNTYQWIAKLLLVNNDALYAVLDESGEYIAQTNAFWLAAFGIVIIVIPMLWCAMLIIAFLRRKIIFSVHRYYRRQTLSLIPIVLYRNGDWNHIFGNQNGDGIKKLINSEKPHNDSCAICLEDFRLNEELRLLPCKHGFHQQCIDPWFDKSSELCPLCKQSIFDAPKSAHGLVAINWQ